MTNEYVAGLFDGEGCIYIAKNLGAVQVSITQQSTGILRLLKQRFGGTVSKYGKQHCHKWRITNKVEMVNFLKAIEPFDIDYAEQPVRTTDYLGLQYVQQRVDTPIMCHEGFFSLKDLVTLIEMEAVGVIGINGERPGGVTNALRSISYAEQRGLSSVLHAQPLGIASAMMLHVAASRHYSLGHASELFGYVMFEDDLLVEPKTDFL